MKRLLHIIVIFILGYILNCNIVYSQNEHGERFDSNPRLFKKAMSMAEQGNYKDAIPIFQQILKGNSNDLDALFNIGICYLNTTNGADTAVTYLNKGLNLLTPEEHKGFLGREFRLSLGKAYQVLLQPLEAIRLYNQLLKNTDKNDTTLVEQINHEIEVCNNANFFIHNPIDITIENMGSGVNSMYDDHSPLIAVSENKLFFTSRRNWIKLSLLPDGQYAEKIYTVPLAANNWESARLLKVFFKQNEHESAVSLSPDGEQLILFRNDEYGKSLYWSNFDGKNWSTPKRFPYPINSYAQETHGSISTDKSTFFFTSDREGGYGGLDIYMTKLDLNGNWGPPINLGPNINTKYDEETPMIHYDGKTLYFSSEGHNSMGRLDVFFSEMQPDSTWSQPVNMGYPINTPDDDFFFVPTVNKSHAYYASSKFSDNYGGSDIYIVKFNEKTNSELAVVEGVVNNNFGNKYNHIRILVTRRKDNLLVGDYRPNEENGHYMLFLDSGYEYEIKETNETSNEFVSYVNVTDELNYSLTKKPILLKDVAMDAPLIRQPSNNIVQNKITQKTTYINETANNISKNNRASSLVNKKDNKLFLAETVEKTLTPEVSKETRKPSEKKYTIQILALQKQPLKDLSYFTQKGLYNVSEYKCKDGFTRYTFGEYDTYKGSLKIKNQLLKDGVFKDIWIRPVSDFDSLTGQD